MNNPPPRFEARITLVLATAQVIALILVNALDTYGYFRDELYYLACTEHIDMGYVDQPPLSIYILAVSRFLFGSTLVGLRMLPALASGVTIFLVGRIACELGGGRFAQALAAVATMLSPIFLAMGSFYSMNAFDILAWAAIAYLLIRLIRTEHPLYWLLLGLTLGLGLLNKVGVLWLGAGIFMGLLLTPQRRWLTTRWPWIAGGVAFTLFLPYVIWNIQHDFAHLEFIRNATREKYASQTAATFLAGQALINNPFTLPLWLAGVAFFFRGIGQQFRLLGYVYIIALLVLLINGHSKPEYLAPAYTMLFAGGAVAIERWTTRPRLRWLGRTYAGLITLSGLALLPLVVPVLPVNTFVHYQDVLGMKPGTAEGKQLEQLPQFFADRFGWEGKAAAVGRVFNSLSPQEQSVCAIYASNYGRCAAIDFFGPRYGLPKSIGGHNSYWLWGPRAHTGEIVIILGGNPEDHRRTFEEVEVVDTVRCTNCMPYENNLPISICRRIRAPLAEVWNEVKHYE